MDYNVVKNQLFFLTAIFSSVFRCFLFRFLHYNLTFFIYTHKITMLVLL